MSSPGGGGGSQPEYGDDFVAARLSIDIPEGAAEGVREITQAVESYRTTLEAAARAEADVNSYLEKMTEASTSAASAQQNLTAQLQQYLSLASRGGMTAPTSGVPLGGATNPFGGASSSQYQTGGLGSPSGERPPNPSDVAAQLGNAQGNNPREWLNMQHSRGGVTAQDTINISHESIQELADKISRREHESREQALHTKAAAPQGPAQQRATTAQRISRASGLAGQVTNELEAGGTNMGLRNLATRGLGWLSNQRHTQAAPGRTGPPATSGSGPEGTEDGTPGTGGPPAPEDAPEDEATGGLSRIIKMIPLVGTALTGLLGAFGVAQGGGQMIQGMRNTASMRGGAAGEGLAVETKARILAMNPFITQDQARQIYQAVMSEGYAGPSGAGADNVIDFMSQNLQHMNISVADSVKMLRSQVMGSGKGDPESVAGAVESLSHELGAIKSLSRNSAISTPDYVKGVEGLQNTMMKGGATPEGAGYESVLAEEVGSGDQVTKGLFAAAAGDMAQGGRAGGLLKAFGGPGGTPLRGQVTQVFPQMVPAFLQAEGGYDQAVWNTLGHFAKFASMSDRGDKASHMNAIAIFQRYVQMISPDNPAATDYHAAEAMYYQLLEGTELGAAKGRLDAVDEHAPQEAPAPRPVPGRNAIPQAAGIPNMPGTAPAPEGGGGAVPGGVDAPTRGGGGGGGGGSGGGGNAAVSIGLTPEAARLLQVIGPSAVSIPANKQAANRGLNGQVNSQPVG